MNIILGRYQGIWLLDLKNMLSFVKSSQSALQSDCTILHSHQQRMRIPVAPILVKKTVVFLHIRVI